jgi:hypothetical protein
MQKSYTSDADEQVVYSYKGLIHNAAHPHPLHLSLSFPWKTPSILFLSLHLSYFPIQVFSCGWDVDVLLVKIMGSLVLCARSTL